MALHLHARGGEEVLKNVKMQVDPHLHLGERGGRQRHASASGGVCSNSGDRASRLVAALALHLVDWPTVHVAKPHMG